MMSFVIREYFPNGDHQTSMELPIYPFSHKDGAFSAPSDSGSVIADPTGRIVGLLTGGSGRKDLLTTDLRSHMQLLSTSSSTSVSRSDSPMPASTTSGSRHSNINLEDIEAGEAMRGEDVSFFFFFLFFPSYFFYFCDFFSLLHAPLSIGWLSV